MTPSVWPTRAAGGSGHEAISVVQKSIWPLLPPLTGDAAFHCQQAAEKTLKAFLSWSDVPFRKTHDLAELGQQCAALDASLEALCRRAECLSSFAWIFRYPGDVEEPPAAEIADAFELAREVYEAILARLPADVRPPA